MLRATADRESAFQGANSVLVSKTVSPATIASRVGTVDDDFRISGHRARSERHAQLNSGGRPPEYVLPPSRCLEGPARGGVDAMNDLAAVRGGATCRALHAASVGRQTAKANCQHHVGVKTFFTSSTRRCVVSRLRFWRLHRRRVVVFRRFRFRQLRRCGSSDRARPVWRIPLRPFAVHRVVGC